ncbi:DUF2201 family putative metallopeptidase [Phytomonospora endophytica]|uniref:Putative metallopeptidase domain-containing protein n=1 Tax=Phytomonospora endophytica TaxID=714109 RepID=A0A841FG01_9ACTN|nr:hypothetical protein [Phytomonospora endophytica]MBB6032482.1 hypothetical protein [Phytomonospora endophytica]GIG66369.1 hypothetical protein Pen01_26640 [Phytomonospora endophytica]
MTTPEAATGHSHPHPRRPVDLADRHALVAHEPAEPEVIERARALKESALLDLGISDSVMTSWLYAKCHHQIATTAIDTAAVVATGAGACMLLYNPDFFCRLDVAGVKFVLFHEARHLVHRHMYVERELREDPVFTIAAEVSINHVAMRRLGRSTLPGERLADGTVRPTGVDPAEVHEAYRRDLRGQGLEPLSFEDFVETDMTVYAELKRMRHPPGPSYVCIHGDGGVPLDDETVARIGRAVLEETMRQARRGNRSAKDELLDLAGRSDGDDDGLSKMWGELGLSALRGQTPKTRRVDWWKRWLIDVLASKLREGERLVYPKKLGAVLLSLGHEPLLSRRGRERTKVVLVAFDTSGSMSDDVVEWLTTLVGQTDGVETHWLSFDGVVMPFKPGERVHGGGGTNFQNVVDYAEGRLEVGGATFEEKADAVIMVTDGYAPVVSPAEPGKWIWLITDGGDDWPERHDPPMACHRVTTGER